MFAAPYCVWINHINNEEKASGDFQSNQPVLDDCIDASTDEVRTWLIKNPAEPDPDPDPYEPKAYDNADVREVLWKKVVLFYFAGRRQDLVVRACTLMCIWSPRTRLSVSASLIFFSIFA